MTWRRFLGDLARTLLGAAVLAPLLLVISAITVVRTACGARASEASWAYLLFSRAIIAFAGSPLHCSGRGYVAPGQAYVVVSNHESNLDPFAIMSALPELVIRFVIKQQLARVPIFGRALAGSGNVVVERQGRGDVRRVQLAMSQRDPRVSLLFFAEGTRAKDGRLQPFKKGAFATAIEAGLPVLPVGVAGTYSVMRPGRAWLARGGIAVEIGAPLEVHADTHRDALHEECFAAVVKLRAQARGALRAAGIEPGGRD